MINLAVRHEHPARREVPHAGARHVRAAAVPGAAARSGAGAVRANQENGERLLRKGELVGVFPEGVKGVGKPLQGPLQARALRPRRLRAARAAHRRADRALRGGGGRGDPSEPGRAPNWVGKPLGPALPADHADVPAARAAGRGAAARRSGRSTSRSRSTWRPTARTARTTRSWSTASRSRSARSIQRMIDGRLARRRSSGSASPVILSTAPTVRPAGRRICYSASADPSGRWRDNALQDDVPSSVVPRHHRGVEGEARRRLHRHGLARQSAEGGVVREGRRTGARARPPMC